MAAAKEGDNVKVHYTGKLKNGEVFDSSEGRNPLEFKIGQNQVLKKFEDSVAGLEIGESASIVIPPEEAYGTRQENLVIKVPADNFPSDIKPEIGLKLQSKSPDGQVIPLKIIDFDETVITVDANHELADEELHFDIKLIEIV